LTKPQRNRIQPLAFGQQAREPPAHGKGAPEPKSGAPGESNDYVAALFTLYPGSVAVIAPGGLARPIASLIFGHGERHLLPRPDVIPPEDIKDYQ
jgi:hypothetical protein